MERTQLFDLMGELKLYGMRASFDEIAGKGLANPIASILSLAMAFRYSFGRSDDATLLEKAVDKVLADDLASIGGEL